MRIAHLVLSIVCVACVLDARAATDIWEKISPRGGAVYCAAVHPVSGDTIYAGLENGLYRSTDKGETWTRLPHFDSYVLEVVFDVRNPRVIYAVAGWRLFKSWDGGENWSQMTDVSVRTFFMDPLRTNRLYIGWYGSIYTYDAVVYVSADGGNTWTQSSLGGPVVAASIAADPGDSNIVYVGTAGDWDFPGSGVYKSFDGGLTWQNYSSGLPYSNIECLTVHSSDPLTLLAGTTGGGEYSANGIYKTTNGGVSWVPSNGGLWSHASVSGITFHPVSSSVLYSAVSAGLYKSEDAGANWRVVDAGMTYGGISSIDFLEIDTDVMYFGTGLGVLEHNSALGSFTQLGIVPLDMMSVVVDHSDPDAIYTTGFSTFKSTDSGAHWRPINLALPKGQVIRQDPVDERVLFHGSYNLGAIFKSTDAGATWLKTLPDASINDIQIDPRNPLVVFAGGLDAPFVGSIFKSENGGNSWTSVAPTQVNCIAIDPVDTRTIYAGGHATLVKSSDAGATWRRIDDELNLPASGYALSLAIDPQFPNVVYCGTYKAGVFKSIDGGEHWTPMSEGIPPTRTGYKDIRDLLIDPTDPDVVYAGTFGSGICVTVNGGAVWQRLGSNGSLSSFELALSADNPDVVYSAGGGLWRYARGPIGAFPEVVACVPDVLADDNCEEGCRVTFDVAASGDWSGIQMVALERRLGTGWVREDALFAPLPNPPWTLACDFDEHYTDGVHEFRAVLRRGDGARSASESVTVTSNRGVPVAISMFESEYSKGGVALRWAVRGGAALEGFHVYRSSGDDPGYLRLNETMIPADGAYEYVDDKVEPGRTYGYRLGAVDAEGEWFSRETFVSVPAAPLALSQNRPNPFRSSTAISFSLPARMEATLTVYDVGGRHVATVFSGTLAAGSKEVSWDGRDSRGRPASSGVYFYRLNAGGRILTRKMLLLK